MMTKAERKAISRHLRKQRRKVTRQIQRHGAALCALAALLEWERITGMWESKCWAKARQVHRAQLVPFARFRF